MAPDSIRTAIGDTLSDLGKDNLENFCDKLVNRGGQPRVRRNRVEGKSYLGITDALVSTFTVSGALDVTVELLKKIGCSQAAEDLDKHLIDTLIERGTKLDKTLHELLENVINSAVSNKIRASPTNEAKMKTLLGSPMKGGTRCKDIIYEILERYEKFLMEELKNA